MSANPAPGPKEVLARLHWVKAGDSELSAVAEDWQAVALKLYDALNATFQERELAGLCRGGGRPLGSYCVQCAWPHRRSHERHSDA